MRVDRFVLDVNVWVSYFINSRETFLAQIISEHEITIFSSIELLDELKRVLAYLHLSKYNINRRRALNFVKEYSVNYSISYPIKKYIADDSDDNYLIALALQTNSGFITSGDRHILNAKHILEKKFSKLRILTRTEFESMFH